MDNQLLELRYERIPGNRGVLLHGLNDLASEGGVPARKLVGKCGEDIFELPSVEVVAGTEETST